jgi:signal transduction histidine kinase
MDHGWLHVHRGADLPAPEGRLAAWLLAVSLLAAVIGVWVIRNTLQPLQATTLAMRRVAEGDLDHRLPDGGPPEVQAAAGAFHAMTQRVKLLLAADRELVAGVSHELRTPLTRLGLRLELLRDDVGPHPKLDDMAADLAELNGLVAELLELSRLQLGQVPVRPEPSHLAALVRQALDASELDAARVQIGTDAPTLSVDPTLTVRALANVFQNVHRYAPEGPVEVRFTPHSLTVADRGPGVPEAQLAQLTEPFVRVDDSRAKHTGGLGLGLMIVKQVQALHEGSVTLANRDGGGLEVTLTWPG